MFAIAKLFGIPSDDVQGLADLSVVARQGSGSACRWDLDTFRRDARLMKKHCSPLSPPFWNESQDVSKLALNAHRRFYFFSNRVWVLHPPLQLNLFLFPCVFFFFSIPSSFFSNSSLFGGFVKWQMGTSTAGWLDSRAVPVAPKEAWPDLEALILVVSTMKEEKFGFNVYGNCTCVFACICAHVLFSIFFFFTLFISVFILLELYYHSSKNISETTFLFYTLFY